MSSLARAPAAGSGVPALGALRAREAELEADWQALRAAGGDYAGMRALLGPEPARDADAPAREARLREAAAAQAAFLERLDAYERARRAAVLGRVERELDRAVGTMTAFYGSRGLRGIRRSHRRLRRLAARCRALEPLHGSPRDHRRIAATQRFYAEVVAFAERIRRLDPTAPVSPPLAVGRLYRGKRALGRLLRGLPQLLAIGASALGILVALLSRRGRGAGTPLTKRVDALFRSFGALRGDEVVVEGRERLPAPESSGEASPVVLYAPAHRDGVTDNVTFAHLDLPDYCVFNAVDQLPGVPRFLKDRAARTKGLIAVGGGRGSAVERALEALARGDSRNLLVYPEGSVCEGFGGTRPPRPNFGEELVRRIRAAGHGLWLVPVTYPDNARFLGRPPRSGSPAERRRRVRVGALLDPLRVDRALAVGGGALVNRLLRLAWLEALPTDGRRLFGMDRVEELERRLDRELDGIRYWGSLEPAPVPDRLETNAGEPLRVREEPFRGKRVRVIEIPASACDAHGRIPVRNLASPGSTELLIGVRDPAHIYLSVGRMRFDGDVFRRLKVREADFVFPGIVIRFRGVPVKSLHALRRRLEEYGGREHRTLTCANSACRVIARAANLRIDDHSDWRPFLPSHVLPSRTIRKLVERGVRDRNGRPMEAEIYRSEGRSLEGLLAEMRRAELRIARDHLRMGTVGLARRLGVKLRTLAARS